MKSAEYMAKRRAYSAAYRARHPDRVKATSRAYMEKPETRAKRRAHKLSALYGITHAEYEQMRAAQDGRCFICLRQHLTKGRLYVDHHHDTGAVRGLLCHHCNIGIGCFGDNPDSLRRAAQYLEDYSTRISDVAAG